MLRSLDCYLGGLALLRTGDAWQKQRAREHGSRSAGTHLEDEEDDECDGEYEDEVRKVEDCERDNGGDNDDDSSRRKSLPPTLSPSPPMAPNQTLLPVPGINLEPLWAGFLEAYHHWSPQRRGAARPPARPLSAFSRCVVVARLSRLRYTDICSASWVCPCHHATSTYFTVLFSHRDLITLATDDSGQS